MTRILFMADIPDPKHSAELAEGLRDILANIKRHEGNGHLIPRLDAMPDYGLVIDSLCETYIAHDNGDCPDNCPLSFTMTRTSA